MDRMLTGLAGALGAVVIATPVSATAQPPPPPVPDITSYPLLSPAEYTVLDGAWYMFSTADGLTCIIDRGKVSYACNGPIPGAPNGANLLVGGPVGAGFANAAADIFSAPGTATPLPPNTRLRYRTISCGTDGAGTTTCVRFFDPLEVGVRDQVVAGFVISPTGSFLFGDAPPQQYRPEGPPLFSPA